MVNAQITNMLCALGFGYDINSLECYCALLQESQRMGQPELSTVEQAQHFQLLNSVKPNSKLNTISPTLTTYPYMSNDLLLKKYGSKPIQEINSPTDLDEFKLNFKNHQTDIVSFIAYTGYNIRLIYEYGELIKATTYTYEGITSEDIKSKLKYLVPFSITQLEKVPVVEIWATLTYDLDMVYQLEKLYHTPYAALTTFLSRGLSDELISCFHIIAYQLHTQNVQFKLHTQKLAFLKSCGFEIPMCLTASNQTLPQLDRTFSQLITYYENKVQGHEVGYPVKGIYVQINPLLTQTLHSTTKYAPSIALLKFSPLWSVLQTKAQVDSITWGIDSGGYVKPYILLSTKTSNLGAYQYTMQLDDLNQVSEHLQIGTQVDVTIKDGKIINLRSN